MTTVFAETALLPDGWAERVRVRLANDGRIAAVEPDAERAPGDEPAAVLLPALSNLHSHAFQRAMAGLTEHRTASFDSFWTWRSLMYRFVERIMPEQVEAIAAQVQVEMLEAGYAAVAEFHYLHHRPDGGAYDDPAELSHRIAAAAAATGIGLTHLPVLYMQANSGGGPLEGGQRRFGCDIDRFAAILDRAGASLSALPDDTALGVAPHSLRTVDPVSLGAAAAMAIDGPVHMHIAEQAAEVDEILASRSARPIHWLLDTQEVDARWCLVHCTQAEPSEIGRLAASGAVAGLCPITEANLGDGIFPGSAFLAAGGRFGVGSDSNLRIGLAEELRQLEHSQRLSERTRAVLCDGDRSVGRTLYEAAARGGAQALGRASGAIAPGLWADLVALDGGALALAGKRGDRILDAWIFAGDDRAVDAVWAAGRRVVRGGRHPGRAAVEARFRAALAALSDAL